MIKFSKHIDVKKGLRKDEVGLAFGYEVRITFVYLGCKGQFSVIFRPDAGFFEHVLEMECSIIFKGVHVEKVVLHPMLCVFQLILSFVVQEFCFVNLDVFWQTYLLVLANELLVSERDIESEQHPKAFPTDIIVEADVDTGGHFVNLEVNAIKFCVIYYSFQNVI